MSLRLNADVATAGSRRFIAKSSREMEGALKALASGSRINNARDDAAGFAISERLRGQLSGTEQAKFNAQNATALVQTAEGGLNEQNNILIRLRELSVNSASDTVGDEERGFLDVEFQQLVSEFDRIAKSTRFGNKELLTGSNEEFSFHVGPFSGPENIVQFTLDADTTSNEVGISSLNIKDKGDSLDAMEDIDKAVVKVAGARSKLGAVQSRFQYLMDNLDVQRENLMEAHSLITDADVAEEVANLTHAKILQESGLMALAQANQTATSVLRLVAI